MQMIGANHQGDQFGRNIFQGPILYAPKNILGPVACKAKVEHPDISKDFFKVFLRVPGMSDGISNHYQFEVSFFRLFQFLVMPGRHELLSFDGTGVMVDNFG